MSRTEKESFSPKRSKYGDFRLPMSISLLVLKKQQKKTTGTEKRWVCGNLRQGVYIYLQSKVFFWGGETRHTEILKAGGLERLREESVEGTGFLVVVTPLYAVCDGENWEREMREKDGLGWGGVRG